jgi:hypothetical protein
LAVWVPWTFDQRGLGAMPLGSSFWENRAEPRFQITQM